MGWSRKRLDQNGKERYTAYYRDARGKACVAGTFARKKDASQAWKTAEVRLAEGRLGDPRRGRQTFQRYVEVEWLPNHVMEATTREGYTYSIYKHIMPWFGPPVVPQSHLAACPRNSGPRDPRQGPRPASCSRLVAPRWWCGLGGREGAAWTLRHLDHAEISSRPSGRRRHCAGRFQQDPQSRQRAFRVNADVPTTAGLITQRSRVQIPPSLPGSAGQRPDRQEWRSGLDLVAARGQQDLTAAGPRWRHRARRIGQGRHVGAYQQAEHGQGHRPFHSDAMGLSRSRLTSREDQVSSAQQGEPCRCG